MTATAGQISTQGAKVSMHEAKISAGKFGLVKIGAALAVVASALCSAMPASADSTGLLESNNVVAIRVGAYIPVNINTKTPFGASAFDVGADYIFQQNGSSTRDLISIDYSRLSKSGNFLQDIPITVGQQLLYGSHTPGFRPYAGYGIGIYNLQAKNPGNTNFSGTANQTNFGGYLNVGFDIGTNSFIDMRYNIIPSFHTVDPDGFNLTAGIRF